MFDNSVIAKYKKGENSFEILVDCEIAIKVKEGKADVKDALKTDDIYQDVKKGEKVPEDILKKVFNTTNVEEIAKKIISEGEIQLTTEYRAKLREEKYNKIVHLIHINTINSKTGTPHTADRIKMVMEDARIKVDEYQKPEAQVEMIVKKLAEHLPIKLETREISVKIPAQYAGGAYHVLSQIGQIKKEDWLSDGSMLAIIKIPAGLQEKLENEVNRLSHGEADIKILSKK